MRFTRFAPFLFALVVPAIPGSAQGQRALGHSDYAIWNG
jgi:hypothetical protein